MVGMIINISDRKDTKFLLYNNTLSVEIKFHWQIIAFFLLYRWHSYINYALWIGYIIYIRGVIVACIIIVLNNINTLIFLFKTDNRSAFRHN